MKEWADAKTIIGGTRVLAGPQLSQQLLHQPDHLAMVLSRYRNAAALIGNAVSVVELGCGEGIGAGILANGRTYLGIDADRAALEDARETYMDGNMGFFWADLGAWDGSALAGHAPFDAAVSLDVIEHIPGEDEDRFLQGGIRLLSQHGIMVIGTPSANAEHLASPQSKAGHINLYTHDRLYALMRRYFRTVQSFGMNDVALHTGHKDMRHYHLMAGIGPR